MKKKILTLICCCSLLSVSNIALGADGMYIGANIGTSFLSDSDATFNTTPAITASADSDTGVAFGLVVGNSFGNYRLEGEIAHQENDIDNIEILGTNVNDTDGDTSSTAFLLNGYYDFKNGSKFTPFIGVGLGFAKVDISTTTSPTYGTLFTSDDDTVFAYQLGFGGGYAVNDKVTLDLKYRYFATSDPDFQLATVEYSSHNIYAGVRIGF